MSTQGPDHTWTHHGGVGCPSDRVKAAAVAENGAKGQVAHSKKSHWCCSWVGAVAGCCLTAATVGGQHFVAAYFGS